MKKAAFGGLLLAALAAGAFYRFGRLDARPIHHDEANQAVKFGALLEHGEYRYDPREHHGPTLYYLTLPAAWARGQKTFAALDETTLRLVPALFGLGLLLLFPLLGRGLGREAVLFAAVLAALSPALTYYSRDFIQEPLFAFFSVAFLIAAGRYAMRPSWGRAAAAGALAGLAFATKETAVLVFGAALCALAAALWPARNAPAAPAASFPDPRPASSKARKARPVHLGVALIAAAAVAALFYSSFLAHPGGILDALRSFRGYAERGTAAGLHVQPWSYYGKLLAFSKSGGLVWSEGVILLLALAGIARAFFAGKPAAAPAGLEERVFWPRLIAVFTLTTAAAYSMIPYKTPWNVMVFLSGFVLLAGYGATWIWEAAKSAPRRIFVLLVLAVPLAHLGRQSFLASRTYAADPRNPYAYAQTVPDYNRLVRRVRELADVHPRGRGMLIKVVAGPYEQWPLPWSLRDFSHVGYWTDPEAAGGYEDVPLVIASGENAARIEAETGTAFQIEHYGLRPDAFLVLLVERGLWDRFLQGRER